MTPDDPDGTVAGACRYAEGKLFRVVVPDSEGQLLALSITEAQWARRTG